MGLRILPLLTPLAPTLFRWALASGHADVKKTLNTFTPTSSCFRTGLADDLIPISQLTSAVAQIDMEATAIGCHGREADNPALVITDPLYQ